MFKHTISLAFSHLILAQLHDFSCIFKLVVFMFQCSWLKFSTCDFCVVIYVAFSENSFAFSLMQFLCYNLQEVNGGVYVLQYFSFFCYILTLVFVL
jgi:hypothetical protein